MQDNVAEYSDRYCAFVDILGFRQLVESLSKDPQNVRTLRALLQKVHGRGATKKLVRAQSISDAVALSTELNMEGLGELMQVLMTLAVDLLCEGFFVRGAVVKGPLYHDERMVFGKALVDAYRYESEVARYPRIIVVRDVRNEIVEQTPAMMNIIKQSDDGPMFLDVLGPVAEVGRKAKSTNVSLDEYERGLHKRFLGIKNKLQSLYEQAMDTPRHFEKVRWFANYWNERVAAHTEYQRVLGAGLEQVTWRR
jgi:hypothetical protein